MFSSSFPPLRSATSETEAHAHHAARYAQDPAPINLLPAIVGSDTIDQIPEFASRELLLYAFEPGSEYDMTDEFTKAREVSHTRDDVPGSRRS